MKNFLTVNNIKNTAIFGGVGFLAYVIYLMFTHKLKFTPALTLGKNEAKKIIDSTVEKTKTLIKPLTKSIQQINIGMTPVKSGTPSKTTLLMGGINNSYDEDTSTPWGL